MTTRFLLVRHAEHALQGRVLVGRMPGVALSEMGRQQASRLAQRLAGERIAAIISSPVQRALETADLMAAALGVVVETDAAFDEIDFGTWTGAALAELDPAPEWCTWNVARGLAQASGGETMLAAQARAVAGLRHCCERFDGQTLVVVSHADVIKAGIMHVLGMPLDLIHRLDIATASISTLELGEGHAILHGLNQGA